MAFRARQSDGKEIVIKLTRGRNSYPVERWVYHEYARVGVPAPQALYYSARLQGIGYPCLVMTMIDGVPPFTVEAQRAGLYDDVGELLGKMHAVPVPAPRFGLGAFLPSAEAKRYADWPEFVTAHHAHPASGEYLRQNGLWSDEAGDLAQLCVMIAAHQFRCVLNHGDFGPDHLIVRAGRITGVIDPGEAFVGPPEYDLAHMALYISERQLRQALSHYHGYLDLEMVYAYAAVIALHKAARAHRAGNATRADGFAVIARNTFLRLKSPDATFPGSDLPLGLTSGHHADHEKFEQ
jgi:aminoglycoside phosphotransferase (APT) family kinase protein